MQLALLAQTISEIGGIMDFDLFQHFRMNQAAKHADSAGIKATEGLSEIKGLQDQIDHLSLVTQAMCGFLEEMGFDRSRLESKIKELDLKEEQPRGAYPNTKKCGKCKRVVSQRHVKCVYCGANV